MPTTGDDQQKSLPLRKAIRIAWRNIRVRWWRSILVTSGIILALSFLTYVRFSDAMLRFALETGSTELREELLKSGATIGDQDAQVQTYWMIGLALLISFVGILNAMVLNVTERFREIGTMKCLGALDSLIIKLYLIESLFQGFGGTILGILAGGCIALLEGCFIYGAEGLTLLPGQEVFRIASTCLLAGVCLSVGGALYPAWTAARMQPIDAMRSEV